MPGPGGDSTNRIKQKAGDIQARKQPSNALKTNFNNRKQLSDNAKSHSLSPKTSTENRRIKSDLTGREKLTITQGNKDRHSGKISQEAVRMVREGINGKKLIGRVNNGNKGEGIKELWDKIGFSYYGHSWCGAFAVRSMQVAGVGDRQFYRALLSAKRTRKYAREHPNKVGSISLRTSQTEKTRNQILSKKGIIRPGDIVVWNSHIGVVVDYDHKTGTLKTAEGNTQVGVSKVFRAAERTYQLRTDVGSSKQQAKAKRYFKKRKSTNFFRFKGKSEPKGTIDNTSPSVKRDMHEGKVASYTSRSNDDRVVVQSDAGVFSRDGGMPATPQQMGVFIDATSATEVAKIVQQQIEGHTLLDRGTNADIKMEIERLQKIQNQLANWGSTYPQQSQDGQAINASKSLELRINKLNTYQKERVPTPGLKGVASFQVLFNGKQVVVPADNRGGKDYMVHGVSGRKTWRSDRTISVKAQRIHGNGPIPEGTYWIDLRQRAKVINPVAQKGWGPERLTIHPYETTHTFGRGGFFIHGGDEYGSAGCIDLTNKIVPFLNHLTTRVGDTALQIQLVVDYSPGRIRWAQEKLTPEQLKKVRDRMPELKNRNERQGLTAEQLVKLERSLGMEPSVEAQTGKVSKALVWNIAAWQKEQQARGIDTGGVDGEIGKRTRNALCEAGKLDF